MPAPKIVLQNEFDWPGGITLVKPAEAVNHPKHYTSHPSGVECIQITEHMGFNAGNAVKYVWRADLKGNALEDLQKARWYIDREIQRREKNNKNAKQNGITPNP